MKNVTTRKLLSSKANGNYSNVVCVMWTQFIKIFRPRLSLCLFVRSLLILFSSQFSPLSGWKNCDQRWSKGHEKKKLSSFRLFVMLSTIDIWVSCLRREEEKRTIFKDSSRTLCCCCLLWDVGGWNQDSKRKREKWGKFIVIWDV